MGCYPKFGRYCKKIGTNSAPALVNLRQSSYERHIMSRITQTTRSSNLLTALFLDHPAQVNESYFAHMRFAVGFAFWLAVAAMAALVHAVIPAFCETTASRIVKRLHARISARH
jgi:hypothetical protein